MSTQSVTPIKGVHLQAEAEAKSQDRHHYAKPLLCTNCKQSNVQEKRSSSFRDHQGDARSLEIEKVEALSAEAVCPTSISLPLQQFPSANTTASATITTTIP